MRILLAVFLITVLLFSGQATADIFYLDSVNPYNNTGTNQTTPTMSFLFSLNESSGSASCELLINDTGYGVNSSVQNLTETSITANSTFSDGLYNWKTNCTTNDSITLESFTRLFYVDTENPTVNYTSPTPNDTALIELTNSDYLVTINATYSDNTEIISCTLFRNNFQYNMDIYNNYCLLEANEWEEGANIIKVRATDKGGNYADTPERTYTINVITLADQNQLYWVIVIVLILVMVSLAVLIVFNLIDLTHDQLITLLVGMLVMAGFVAVLITMSVTVI